MLHKSEEDYIKFIYEASTSNKTHLSLKDIASYFSYREQSVNEMIKKLQKKGYVKYLPYQGVTLLKKGERFYGNIFSGKYLDCGTLNGYINSGLEISKNK